MQLRNRIGTVRGRTWALVATGLAAAVLAAVLVPLLTSTSEPAREDPAAGSSRSPSSPSGAPSVEFEAVENPTEFNGPRVALPDLADRPVLMGDRVFSFEDHDPDTALTNSSMRVTDLRTGETVWTAEPTVPDEREVSRGDWVWSLEPDAAEPAADALVYNVLSGTDPGSGTQRSREVVQVSAFAAADGTEAWTVDIPLAQDGDEGMSLAFVTEGGIVAVGISEGVHYRDWSIDGRTVGLDARSGEEVWSVDALVRYEVDGMLVMRSESDESPCYRVCGVAGRTGEIRWRIGADDPSGSDDYATYYVDDELYLRGEQDDTTVVHDLATGSPVRELPGVALHTAMFGDGIVIDWRQGSHDLVAFDTATGEIRWALPSESRVGVSDAKQPRLIGDVLRVETEDGDPVVLDPRTGEDILAGDAVERDVRGSMVAYNEYGALARSQGEWFFAGATG